MRSIMTYARIKTLKTKGKITAAEMRILRNETTYLVKSSDGNGMFTLLYDGFETEGYGISTCRNENRLVRVARDGRRSNTKITRKTTKAMEKVLDINILRELAKLVKTSSSPNTRGKRRTYIY